jgi:DNA polymerase III delta prime subunit
MPQTKGIPKMLFTEKYKPTSIDGFTGIEKARRTCKKIAANPFESAWIFVGKSGTGKTTLAFALAEEMKAELIHIPSGGCTLDVVKGLKERLSHMPMFGSGWHLVVVDEADQMTLQAQHMFLSFLDSTNRPKNTIFVFTCNSTEKLEDRLLSRFVGQVLFSTQGMNPQIADLLERIWEAEADGEESPNFARIAEESKNNVRAAISALQNRLICG